MIDPPDLWEGVVRRLAGAVPRFALEAWLRPLEAHGGPAGLVLVCPSELHRERVGRYAGEIARCAREEVGRELPVRLEVAAAAGAAASGDPPRLLRSSAPAGGAAPPEPARAALAPLPLCFETFVVGPCNALAREAAHALAHGRQGGASPLFLASPVGLGKTHLACSVAREARRQGGRAVVYASAEAFTSELMTSIRSGSTAGFKRRFRDCDLLVLEDVQFLARKTATQLELFHTLQHLRAAGRAVVLTGDRTPRELEGFDPRITSLMVSGLVAEIEPPDATVRRSILRARAAAGGVRLPEHCLERLVEGARGSVRDLESVLTQLVAMALLLRQPIDLPLAEAALRKLAPEPGRRPLEPAALVGVVARFFGTSPGALAGRSRRRDVIEPRRLAMYLCRRCTGASLSEIGRLFGRSHTAARNAYDSVEREILERAPLRYQLEELLRRIDAEARG
jgi:chromosomal replication initiator protein